MSFLTLTRILLADDDHDDTFLFREALEQVPVETRLSVAENGAQLLQLMKGADPKPDIIFLDMNMPVKNGLECLEEIRGTAGYEQVPGCDPLDVRGAIPVGIGV